MENMFKEGDKIVIIKHVGIAFKLLSWVLKNDSRGKNKWVNESKDHVDFFVAYNLFLDREKYYFSNNDVAI
jgi:hypothetical protein